MKVVLGNFPYNNIRGGQIAIIGIGTPKSVVNVE